MFAMLKIIIVEDHKDLRESLLDVMASEGHHVAAFESAEALWSGCSFATVDIVVLDLNLPGEDGIGVSRRIRAEHPDVGIVMLTARGEPEERRTGYENGADIYLTKPSSVAELTSSIWALARRLNKDRPEPGGLVLDTMAMTLSGPEESVALSASEVELLAAFARAPLKRLKTVHIADMIGRDGEISKAAIEVRIVRLRKKIIAAGTAGQPINVVRNHGYQLSARIDVI
jgi:DNA-binding response OmpR family regulator